MVEWVGVNPSHGMVQVEGGLRIFEVWTIADRNKQDQLRYISKISVSTLVIDGW